MLQQNEFNFDDYSPTDMTTRVEQAAKRKANLHWISLLMLSILAGSFIAIGAEFFTLAVFDSTLSIGFTRIIGGICFSIGLILVVIAGGELFTGNTLLMIGFASGTVTYKQVLKNWSVSYLGNFVGAMGLVLLVFLSDLWKMKSFAMGVKIVQIAADKTNLTFLQGFSRGILCNVLVCLAVWMCFSARSVISKIAAIVFPITAFVALSFEHSIANMYFIPMGLMIKNNPDVLAGIAKNLPELNMSHLNIMGFLGNLLSVTLGNIVGGAIMVGFVYWMIFVLPEKLKKEKKPDAK